MIGVGVCERESLAQMITCLILVLLALGSNLSAFLHAEEISMQDLNWTALTNSVGL